MGKKQKDCEGKRRGKHDNISGVVTPFLYFAGCVAVLAVSAGVYQLVPGAVVHLRTEDSFREFVAAHQEGALIDFFAQGCPWCKELEPEFEAAAKELKSKGGAPLASVDYADLPELVKSFNIKAYPTILWFRNGESVDELSPLIRDRERLVKYVDRATRPGLMQRIKSPGLTEFDTRADWIEAAPQLRDALTADSPPMIVGFAGTEGVRAALEAAEASLRGKTTFIFIKEAPWSGAALRALSQDSADDKSYDGTMTPEAVRSWASEIVQSSKRESGDRSCSSEDHSCSSGASGEHLS